MSATVWLVIIIPIVLLAWLVGQVMPTPRDRQLVKLRARARELDLTVQVRARPDPDPDPGARVDGSGRVRDARLDVAGYTRALRLPSGVERRHLPTWRIAWMRHHAETVLDEGLPPGWRIEAPGLPLVPAVFERISALLARTPRGTVDVEVTAGAATLHWRERGDVDEVDAIAALLDEVRDLALELAVAAARSEARARGEDDGDPRSDA